MASTEQQSPASTTSSTNHHRALAAIRRRLEKLELEHLRNHAVELHEKLGHANIQLEAMKRELDYADDCSASWRDECLRMMEECGGAISLSKDGALHVIKPEIALPRIGADVAALGGIYAGIARGDNGAPDYHLILLPDEADEVTWTDAKEWAEKAGGALPSRREQSLLFANLKDLFKPEWYWSCEQHASDPDYAWLQNFSYGYQTCYYVGSKFRARAVRRFPI